jgi:hypothetical protein
MAFHLVRGIVRCLRPLQRRRRIAPRHKTWSRLSLRVGSDQRRVLLRDWSSRGMGSPSAGMAARPGALSADRFHDSVFGRCAADACCPMWRVGLRVATPRRSQSRSVQGMSWSAPGPLGPRGLAAWRIRCCAVDGSRHALSAATASAAGVHESWYMTGATPT